MFDRIRHQAHFVNDTPRRKRLKSNTEFVLIPRLYCIEFRICRRSYEHPVSGQQRKLLFDTMKQTRCQEVQHALA